MIQAPCRVLPTERHAASRTSQLRKSSSAASHLPAVADLRHADVLPGKHRTEIDLCRLKHTRPQWVTVIVWS